MNILGTADKIPLRHTNEESLLEDRPECFFRDVIGIGRACVQRDYARVVGETGKSSFGYRRNESSYRPATL